MSVTITNIQHLCFHDGPGIRTTVFLKGCNLKCPWCCNPENIDFEIDKYFGEEINLEDLKKELLKDKEFYSLNNGGVTFSGGEPILQINKLIELLKELKSDNINICFETALFINEKQLKLTIPYVDEFIVDIKILNNKLCRDIIGGDVNLFLNNLKLLFKNNKKIIFRFPISEYTLKDNNLELISMLIEEYKPSKFEIFKIHNLAQEKYEKLNKNFYYKDIDDETVEKVLHKFKEKIDNIEIIKY